MLRVRQLRLLVLLAAAEGWWLDIQPVMLNYGVHLESCCLVGCICCILPLHL